MDEEKNDGKFGYLNPVHYVNDDSSESISGGKAQTIFSRRHRYSDAKFTQMSEIGLGLVAVVRLHTLHGALLGDIFGWQKRVRCCQSEVVRVRVSVWRRLTHASFTGS